MVPATVGDWIGLGYVVVLVATFFSCLIWYCCHRDRDVPAGKDETRSKAA